MDAFKLILAVALICTGVYIEQVDAGSCHNFTGCCNSATFSECLGDPLSDNCYCDQICYEFGDCCSDIANTCLAASNEPTASTGSCVTSGFSGCCDPNVHFTCHGSDNVCYCDQVCYSFGDCCSDIMAIGCFQNASSPSATPTGGSCVAAGFENCCNSGNSPNCYGNPPSCFCDQLCYKFGDCCSDIEQVCAGTIPPTTDHGSCTGLGYTGCCKPGVNKTCHGSDGICYCDQICYKYGDCCDDIDELGCLKASPSAQGSCKAAGYESCCDPKQGAICWGHGGDTCYCDELCYSYGDCCPDVADIGCIAPSVNPTAGDGTCIGAGHIVCCVPSDTNSCVGSNGICSCSADCYDIGNCCKDIMYIGCTVPTPTVGPCVEAGYTQCCHPSQQNGANCFGDPPICYCDQVCYSFGDCCSDVTKIGCLKPSVTPPPSNGSCANAGYTTCCVPSDTDKYCHGHPETCFCDAVCHLYGDCCDDINDIGCTTQSFGSCKNASYTKCCLGENLDCVGLPSANCFCDQGCSLRDDCCADIYTLSNCTVLSVPGPVTNLMVTSAGNTSLDITWGVPLYPNDVSHYEILLTNYSGEGDIVFRIQLPFEHLTEHIDGLQPYKPYIVTVYGVNIDGNGLNRTKINFTMEGTPIAAPDNILVVRNSATSIKVSWSPLSLLNAQGFVTGYKVTYYPINGGIYLSKTVSGTTTSITIQNVDRKQKYAVIVAAMTKSGLGVSSKVSYEKGYTNTKTPVNIGVIVGSIAGGVGVLTLIVIAVLVVMLIIWKTKGSKRATMRYQKLLTQANKDYYDDDDD